MSGPPRISIRGPSGTPRRWSADETRVVQGNNVCRCARRLPFCLSGAGAEREFFPVGGRVVHIEAKGVTAPPRRGLARGSGRALPGLGL